MKIDRIIGRVRHLTHVYLCTKRELYRELNAAKAHAKAVEVRLEHARESVKKETSCSAVYFNSWRREQLENGQLKAEIASLKHRIVQTPRVRIGQAS